MITSPRNPRIQWVRKLQNQARLRRQEGVFVVEGVRLAEEVLRAGWTARLVLHSPGLTARGQEAVARFAAQGVEVEVAAEQALAAASDTETPQGILAVVERRELPLPDEPDFVVILDALRNPGNLGAILRSAAAAGVQALFFAPGNVDPFSPKVVRAAMGAHFHLPIVHLDWQAIQAKVKPALRLFLAEASGGRRYTDCDLTIPLALIVGGEAAGASRPARELADERLHIPMAGEVESLNAAVAAAVLLFEVVRQRAGGSLGQQKAG